RLNLERRRLRRGVATEERDQDRREPLRHSRRVSPPLDGTAQVWLGSRAGGREKSAMSTSGSDVFPDPKRYLADSIDPVTRQLTEAIEKILAQTTPIHLLVPADIRAARERGDAVWGPLVTADEARVRKTPGPAGEISVRVIAPPEPRGVYLHFHGGGWALGAAHHQDV